MKENIHFKELLTPKEAMELLSISRPTLARWQKEGKVPYYKVGRKVLFKRTELLKTVENGKIINST